MQLSGFKNAPIRKEKAKYSAPAFSNPPECRKRGTNTVIKTTVVLKQCTLKVPSVL
jgi:hypothetical protein